MTIEDRCCETTRVSMIKVEEFGRKAVIRNAEKKRHTKIKVDGCVIVGLKAADWIISLETLGDAIIELKGKDVEHATKQVLATADHWNTNGYRVGKLAALIVSTQFPKISTAVRRAQQEFRRLYDGPLHVVTKNYEGHLQAIFSSGGPHKV